MANIDHKHIYKLIQRKQWLEALNNVSQYFQDRSPDELTMGAVKTFEDMFFAEIEIAATNYTTSLFKSNQEIEFFMGVREVYPMFTAYQNVALSCVMDFEKIKDSLSPEEKEFFFKGIIDCVVFDQHNSYKPTKFFELDSSYHDSPKQKQKDNYKDNILSLAGQKLCRVRKTSANQGRMEFIKLIRELVL